jgi:hypothetical protein
MPSILRKLLPLRATAKGKALVASEEFQLCVLQKIDRLVPSIIKDFSEVEPFVRNVVIRALLPQRQFDEQELIDFYLANVIAVDSAVQPIVNLFLEFSKDPRAFARRMLERRGIKTYSPPVAKGMMPVPLSDTESMTPPVAGEFVDVEAANYNLDGLRQAKKQAA